MGNYTHGGLLGGYKPPPPPKAPTGYRPGQSLLLSQIAGQQSAADPAATQPQQQGGGGISYDFSQDPALQRILAMDQAARANARAEALAAEKQLAIQLGDATGILSDKNTALEAARNPYSTLASLAKAYKSTRANTDESMNQNNLFYSGARAKQISADAYNFQHQQYDARQAALQAESAIQANLANALYGYDTTDANAYTTAEQQAQQQALTYGYGASQTAPAPTTPATAASSTSPSVASALAQPASTTGFAKATFPSFRALPQNRVPVKP